jgi:pyruvate/2-oxoglutarate/acetoin dehydrogenase E1 component
MAEALNEALHTEMERDPGVFVVGEDIARIGGLFQVTAGLLERFGPQRVIDSPISEAGQVGAGVGAALVGCRPVVELQIADFVTLTMDQVVNHAAKWRYMSGGKVTVPFVLRGAVSSGIGMAGQHSQTLEAWFVHAPGLVVIMPSTPYDALSAAPVRVTAKDTPIPYAAQLERAVLPQVDDLVAAVTGLLEPVTGS